MYFTWKDDYAIGDPVIDGQHRTLVDLANLLAEACALERSETITRSALDALFQYAEIHFAREEAFFAAHDCPTLDEHRREHAALIGDLKRFRSGARLGVFQDMLETLNEWMAERLLPHMTDYDRRTHQSCHIETATPPPPSA